MTTFDESTPMPAGIVEMFGLSRVSLSIADYTLPDCPLVGVNDAFLWMTGYSAEDVLGRNCRFLQPEGDAGAVRLRMREFLADPEQVDGKFVIPNVTRDGKPFLNLVYMAKLARDGQTAMVLGSQFAIDAPGRLDPALYDRALSENLQRLDLVTRDSDLTIFGSFDALASSHSMIARARMD